MTSRSELGPRPFRPLPLFAALVALALQVACAAPPEDEAASQSVCTKAGRDVPATSAPSALPAEAVAAIRKQATDRIAGSGAAGYSVAVWRDGAVVYAEAFGHRNPEGDPVTPGTLFEIGSDSKKVAALALLQEVQARKVAVTQTFHEVAPELELASDPTYFARLTIAEALSHRSGLFDYTPWTQAPGDSALRDVVLGRFVENEYALMPPGLAYNYSNPDYSLVGYLTERLAHRPWADVVTERVFAPLGMRHTYARLRDMLAREHDIATGLGAVPAGGFDTFDLFEEIKTGDGDPGWVAPQDQIDNAFVRPAGLIWSTASDHARLLGFLVDGAPAVLCDSLRRELSTLHAPAYPHVRYGYGYGLFTSPLYVSLASHRYETPFLWHGGNTLTMSSAAVMLPEQRVAVAVLSNGQDDPGVDAIAQVALEGAAAGRLPAPNDAAELIAPPSGDLRPYAGHFHDPNLGAVTIDFNEDHLTIDIPSLADVGGGTTTADVQPFGLDVFTFSLFGQTFDLGFYDAPDGTPRKYAVNRDFVLTRDP